VSAQLEERDSSGNRRVWNTTKSIAFISVLVASAVTGYAFWKHYSLSEFGSDDHSYTHHLRVHLVPASSEDFQILLPLPVTGEGMPPNASFIEEVTCSNPDLALSIVMSDRGYALEVSGRGEANISWSSHWSADSSDLYDTVSMLSTYDENATSVSAFVYNHGCQVTVDFDYAVTWRQGYGGRTYIHCFDETVAGDGWHDVDIEIMRGLIN
jgi:hypothetical protein